MKKHSTYEAAIAANPDHPVSIHAEFCLSNMAGDSFLSNTFREQSHARINRVKDRTLAFLNSLI